MHQCQQMHHKHFNANWHCSHTHSPTHSLPHSHTHSHTLTRQNTVHAALSSAANIIRHPLARSKDLKPKRPMRSQQPQSLQQLFTQPIPQQGGWGHSMTTHSLTHTVQERVTEGVEILYGIATIRTASCMIIIASLKYLGL
jgi:hypothetical protein